MNNHQYLNQYQQYKHPQIFQWDLQSLMFGRHSSSLECHPHDSRYHVFEQLPVFVFLYLDEIRDWIVFVLQRYFLVMVIDTKTVLAGPVIGLLPGRSLVQKNFDVKISPK